MIVTITSAMAHRRVDRALILMVISSISATRRGQDCPLETALTFVVWSLECLRGSSWASSPLWIRFAVCALAAPLISERVISALQ